MCEQPVPCQCTLDRREQLRAEHAARSDTLGKLAYRLSETNQISEAERDLLYRQAEQEWDDAIHVASPDDPLRSLCGSYGRNLADLPDRPDGASGCWTCLHQADELAGASSSRELATV